MFKKTLNFSELKNDPTAVSEMKDSEVIQILHRGSEVKVMMTQEHYFQLLARLEKTEGTSKTTAFNAEKLISDFDKRLNQFSDLLGKTPKKARVG